MSLYKQRFSLCRRQNICESVFTKQNSKAPTTIGGNVGGNWQIIIMMVDFIVSHFLVEKWKDKKLMKTPTIWLMEFSGFRTFLTAVCSKKKKKCMWPSISELMFCIYVYI